jgi:Zn-dependent protease with chaperone function
MPWQPMSDLIWECNLDSGDTSPRYLDGTSSLSQSVKLSMTDQSLIITSEGKSPVIWLYTKIFVKEDWHDITGAILGFKDNLDAGLAIHDNRHFITIQKRLAKRSKASFIIPTQYRYLFLMIFGAVISLFLLFPLLSQLSSLVTFIIPYSLEKKLGDVVLTDMSDEFKPCDDKEAVANLQKITDRLYNSLNNKEIKPEIHLFKSYSPNAFSLPGGKIAVLSEFLADAKSENEIAAVLAHEMGHMVKRDSLEAFVESQGLNLIAGMIGSSGAYGGVAEFASLMQAMNYSRKKEFAADEFGAKLLTKAGYSPKGLSSFLYRMDKQDGVMSEVMKHVEFLSTHPDTKERIKRIDKMGGPAKYRASLTADEFLKLQKACSTELK